MPYIQDTGVKDIWRSGLLQKAKPKREDVNIARLFVDVDASLKSFVYLHTSTYIMSVDVSKAFYSKPQVSYFKGFEIRNNPTYEKVPYAKKAPECKIRKVTGVAPYAGPISQR